LALAASTRLIWLAAFFAAWIPWNYHQLRIDRKTELAAANERRAWFEPIAKFVRAHPDTGTFVYNGAPESLAAWGVNGALNALRPNLATSVTPIDAPGVLDELAKPHLAVLVWDQQVRAVHVLPRLPDVSYMRLSPVAPLWQMGKGWIGNDAVFRWMSPHATARLFRPARAHGFEVVVYVPSIYIDQLHQGRLDVSLNGKLAGSGTLDKPIPTTFRFNLPPAPEGPVEVDFNVSPPLKDPSGGPLVYGAPIAAFGFVP
jgi:hypothetical protein